MRSSSNEFLYRGNLGWVNAVEPTPQSYDTFQEKNEAISVEFVRRGEFYFGAHVATRSSTAPSLRQIADVRHPSVLRCLLYPVLHFLSLILLRFFLFSLFLFVSSYLSFFRAISFSFFSLVRFEIWDEQVQIWCRLHIHVTLVTPLLNTCYQYVSSKWHS
jgi:hypothetical protein